MCVCYAPYVHSLHFMLMHGHAHGFWIILNVLFKNNYIVHNLISAAVEIFNFLIWNDRHEMQFSIEFTTIGNFCKCTKKEHFKLHRHHSQTVHTRTHTRHISRRLRAVPSFIEYSIYARPYHTYIHTFVVWKWLDFTNQTETISESNILELIQYQNTVCNCVTLHRCL